MATLNYAFKEISCKIVYYGCGLCGKTTNLIHVHKTVPGKFRGELVSLATEQDRTLFFDFLPLDLGEVKGFKTKFQLYTVPGQVYYNATRKLVLRGVDGIVFVADSQKDRLQENLESFENLKQNLAEYGYHLQVDKQDEDGIPWILQLNKRDMPQISGKEEIIEILKVSNTVPTIDAVAVSGQGVKETLKGISSLVIQRLNKGGSVPGGSGSKPGSGSTPKPVAATQSKHADDEYEAINEDELSDDALEGKKSSQKASTPKPAKAAAPKPEPAAAAADEDSGEAAPSLTVTQDCDGLWRGMKTGKGSLTLAQISSGSKEYQLTGFLSFMGIFKRTFSKKLVLKGADARMYEGQQCKFHLLESAEGQDGPAVNVMVLDGSTKSLFMTYKGFGGEIAVLATGKKTMP